MNMCRHGLGSGFTAGLVALLILLLSGCVSTSGIPDTTYFRLPTRAAVTALPAPLFAQPISVDTLIADGLYSDQALIYSLDPEAARLRAYHYQLWVDPPVRMLQRRLIGALRDLNASAVVADRLPSNAARLRVSGRIERFERVLSASGWVAVVQLQLRVEGGGNELPMLLREYKAEVPAAAASVKDSVTAMGEALDQVLAAFLRDLQTAAAGV
ncbi:MAG: ABC-type transport auxiliary lipoprotein family protein [Pseudomarimonas sp.]